MMAMEDGDLQPCPFCADDEHVAVENEKGKGWSTWYAWCGQCRAQGPVCDSEEAACREWDTRKKATP